MRYTAGDNVGVAFEMLLEMVEAEIDGTTGAGSAAFQARNMEAVEDCRQRVDALTSFRNRLADMRKEWFTSLGGEESSEESPSGQDRRNLGRLRKGQRTPEPAFYEPILEVIVALGGSGKLGVILQKVGDAMKDKLRAVDFEPLASDPELPRWRNTAQWARYAMVQEGLLDENSKRGTWVITQKGRESVAKRP